VLHRDIRPANILISQPEGSVWIIDFEDAKFGGDADSIARERKTIETMLQTVKSGEEWD